MRALKCGWEGMKGKRAMHLSSSSLSFTAECKDFLYIYIYNQKHQQEDILTVTIQNVIPFRSIGYPRDKNIASDKGHFEDFSKEKGRFFIMLCFTFWSCFVTFCHTSPDIFYSKDKNFEFYNSFPTFWGQNLKFTIHLSLFTVTIHCHYSPVTVHSEFLPI